MARVAFSADVSTLEECAADLDEPSVVVRRTGMDR
jgi:hypothetical protein